VPPGKFSGRIAEERRVPLGFGDIHPLARQAQSVVVIEQVARVM